MRAISSRVTWAREIVEKKKVIGFVGMPGSGKSTALEVARRWGPVVIMGNVVRAAVRATGQDITPENLRAMAQSLRNQHGPQAISLECIKQIISLPDNIVFVDGLRSPAEVKTFRQNWKFPVIAITAKDNNRHRWLAARGRPDDTQATEKIRLRDEQELNFGVGDVIANAEYSIPNKGSIEDLQKRSKTTIEKVLKHY